MWIYRQTFSLINCWHVNISLKKFQSSCFCLQLYQWLTPPNVFCQDLCYNYSRCNCRLIIFKRGKLNNKYFLGFGTMPGSAFTVESNNVGYSAFLNSFLGFIFLWGGELAGCNFQWKPRAYP